MLQPHRFSGVYMQERVKDELTTILSSSLLIPSSVCFCRCWPKSCATSQRRRRDSIWGSSMELPNDMWVRPKSCLSGGSIYYDRRVQYCGGWRHGKHEQGETTVPFMTLHSHSGPFGCNLIHIWETGSKPHTVGFTVWLDKHVWDCAVNIC